MDKERNIIRVGPVHAGIIEPGVFEFECTGERVVNCSVQLGYQHRGIEALIVKAAQSPLTMMCLSEQIAGDSTIAHATAMAQILESGVGCSNIIKNERIVGQELERMAMDIADLAALSGDIAYESTKAVCEAQRTLVINCLQRLCGNRFGRTLIRPAGSHYRIDDTKCDDILETTEGVAKQLTRVGNTLMNSPQVLGRLEELCIVKEGYGRFSGDLKSRVTARLREIQEAQQLIAITIKELQRNRYDDHSAPNYSIVLPPNSELSATANGYRGEVRHSCKTSSEGLITEYHITDPSAELWAVLMESMKDGALSDFPINNKSFNLSYCAVDK